MEASWNSEVDSGGGRAAEAKVKILGRLGIKLTGLFAASNRNANSRQTQTREHG